MKRFVAALIVMAMIVALASTAFAYKEVKYEGFLKFTDSAWGYGKVTNNSGRNKSSICIRKGSVVWADMKKGDWYRVWVFPKSSSSDEAEAKPADKVWINGKYLKKAENPGYVIFSSGGSGRATYMEDSDDEKITGGYKYVKIAKKGRRTNIRKSAGLNGKSYGVLRYGSKLKLHKDKIKRMDARGVYWYKVTYKGSARWVSAAYTKLVK